jgi:hypothetical protein
MIEEDCATGKMAMNKQFQEALGGTINVAQSLKYGWVCPLCNRVMGPHVPFCLTNHGIKVPQKAEE